MTIGIYKLIFDNDDFYIGRSVNIEDRYKDHISLLSRLKHPSSKVQKAYNSYGRPKLEILEGCSISNIKDREAYWISKENATILGLNVCEGGDDILVGEKHPMARYTNLQILEAVRLLAASTPVLSHKEVSERSGITDAVVKDLVSEKTHVWVKEEHPELYQQMLDTKILRKKHSLSNLNPFANKKVDVYKPVQSPSGEVFYIEHLTNFAKEHGLQASNLSKVLYGTRKHHKGWKLYASND